MKYSLLLLILCVSTAFALPCPNGNGFLYKGDSIASVIQQCGEPTEKNTKVRMVYSLQQWDYYRPHAYDSGFAQISIIFRNGVVSSILINDRYPFPTCRQSYVQVGIVSTIQTSCGDWSYNTTYTNLCGPTFGIGDTLETVASFCGAPASQANLQNETVEETELYYSSGNAQTIVFQNGRLTEWK